MSSTPTFVLVAAACVALCCAEFATDEDVLRFKNRVAFEQALAQTFDNHADDEAILMSYNKLFEKMLRQDVAQENRVKNRARRTLSHVKSRACGQRLGHLVKATCPTGCTVDSEFLAEGITNACCEKMCSQAEIVEGCCPV